MTAEVPNPAVSHDILKQIWKWKEKKKVAQRKMSLSNSE